MYPSQLDLLQHIRLEADFIVRNISGKSKDAVLTDEVLTRAIIRGLEIIGEASKRLHPDFKVRYPHIEWKEMAGTRDILIHEYFGVDYRYCLEYCGKHIARTATNH
jgi:uncharacterized protein with HEPN domain